jgi:hypothetical protein
MNVHYAQPSPYTRPAARVDAGEFADARGRTPTDALLKRLYWFSTGLMAQ